MVWRSIGASCGADGPTALELEGDDIDDMTPNTLDRKKLKTALRNIQAPKAEAKDADEVKDPGGDKAAADTASKSTTPSGKRFASFVSHFKRECGTEARLVQLQLKQILPEDSDEVFLDSGAAAQLARTPDPR